LELASVFAYVIRILGWLSRFGVAFMP